MRFRIFSLLLGLFACTISYNGYAGESDSFELLTEKEFVASPGWRKTLAYHLLRTPVSIAETLVYPIEKFVVFAERVDLKNRLRDTFSNADHTIFYYPALSYSTDDGIGAGGNYKHDHFIQREDELHLKGRVFGNGDHKISFLYESPKNVYRMFVAKLQADYKDNSTARFFGIGSGSQAGDQSIYHLNEARALADFAYRSPFKSFYSLHGLLGYFSTGTENGNSQSSKTKILEVFDASELPGFFNTFEYLQTGLAIVYDSRNFRKNPTRGQLLVVDWSHYEALSVVAREFEFNRFHLRGVQLLPFAQDRRVFALGLELQSIEERDAQVPFQVLPDLGNKTRLRGYNSGRFRDRRSFVANFEYRYRVWDTLVPHSMYGLGTFFIDTGQVFSEWNEIDFTDLKMGGGFGFVFGYRDNLVLRLQLAYGNEGLVTSLGLEHAF